jgi:hypothetical protein
MEMTGRLQIADDRMRQYGASLGRGDEEWVKDISGTWSVQEDGTMQFGRFADNEELRVGV